jgi:lysophospholipase L1-like esterase
VNHQQTDRFSSGSAPVEASAAVWAVLLSLLLAAWSLPAASPWEKDIAAFEAADRTNPPPKEAILFVGSSSIRLWKTLDRDFSEFVVINRGFGGSHMSDSVEFAERIVLPYRPRVIVVYAGDNDIAQGKPPQQVAEDFRAFVKKVHAALPATRIAYLAVKASPSRWTLAEQMRSVNRRIAEFAGTDKRLAFVDVWTPMLGTNELPRPELFQPDQLHLNAKGYELWTNLLRPFLK